ncbi:MAG: flagellar hook capping protein [Acidocella sp. 20-63-7]|nr:MAG: flagellar hook capping protein [Acidocella sp. 20-63-7]
MTNLAAPSSASAAVNAASVAASTTASTTSTSGSASTLTQADFLQLLTAQLKYQSPTSPANPTQMASEFAAISTVNGIDQLNTQVSNIQSSTAAAQMAQASTLVGKQVAVSGDALVPNAAGSATGVFNLAGPAQSVNVSVLNPNGTIANTINLGALSAGQQNFTWSNGTPGTQYTYQVNAVSAAGNAVSATPYTVYTVQGVNVSGTSPTLNVQGSSTTVPVSSIQTVLGVA